MSIKKYVQLKTIKNSAQNPIDDFYICCSSFEERCLGGTNITHDEYKTRYSILFNYTTLEENKDKIKHKNKLMKILQNIGILKTYSIDPDKPIYILSEVVNFINNNIKNLNNVNIKIDITAFMKWHLLILLKLLDQNNLINNIEFIYTEPLQYAPNLYQPLSFGIKEIFPVPLYYGDYDYSKENLLVIFLGYEGNRALALFESLDPDDCILLIADPPYWSKWKNKTEEMNEDIINLLGRENVHYIHSRKPSDVCESLIDLLRQNESYKNNTIIAPLGTKPQTLGLFFYLKKIDPENTMLIYASPLRYNELFYSQGIGRTWGFHL